jgi:membrane-associated phospholipid phosphatase
MPRRARLALIAAAIGVMLLALTWYAKVHVPFVRHADASILRGFADLHRPAVNHLTNLIASLCDPKPYVFLAAIPILVALARRRPRAAGALAVIMLGANETTQLLKPLLAEPHMTSIPGVPPIVAASFPSGHATAAMSLALCSVIAVPARWRPRVAAAMAAFAVAVCYSFLELAWHYPSDVLGGFLVAAVWTLLGGAVLDYADARWPRHFAAEATETGAGGRSQPVSVSEALTPIMVLLLGVAAFGALLLIAHPHAVTSYARAHEVFVLGAVGIGALSLVLATGTTLALRR